MRSYQEKSRIRLWLAVLLSIALHVLLLITIRLAPASLSGRADVAGELNIMLQKNSDEAPYPVANEEPDRGTQAVPPEPAPPVAASPPPPVKSDSQTQQAPVPQNVMAIDKPDAPKQAEQTFKQPDLPPLLPGKIAPVILNQPLTNTEAPPRPIIKDVAINSTATPTLITPDKIILPQQMPPVPVTPITPVAPVQPLSPPAQHVTQTAPLIPAPVQTPVLQPLQGKPAEQSAQTLPPAEHNSPAPSRADASKSAASGQISSDRPAHLDNEKSGVVLDKPANVDTSSFPGLDIKTPEKPADNNGLKLHLGGMREKTISLKEQDLTYQLYAESVRMKLERLGRLNYPIEAARNNISGTLVVLISIRADGSLEDFKILQPSYDVLNDAASRIVQLSSPFSVFPPKLKEDLDVLNIQITWTFESSQQLFQ